MREPIKKFIKEEIKKALKEVFYFTEEKNNKKLVHFVHKIYEGDSEYPVVTHIFTGKDKEEAKGYFDAHMKTDKFMSDMENEGKYNDIEGHVEKNWK